MFTTILQAFVLYAFSYAFYKLMRTLLTRSALDNLPGPSSQSFLFGKIVLQSETALIIYRSPGVFPQIFNPKGWDFHKEIAQKCMDVLEF